jgi:hypothetical protein
MHDATAHRRWHHRILVLPWLLGLLLVPHLATAQTTTALSSLTILVRDADGHPLPGMTVKVFWERPAGPAREVAALMTDTTGSLTVQRLDPEGTYVVQFHSAAPIVVDGERVGSLPMQFVDDQNAGREVRDGAQLPGFAIELRGQPHFTQRFVVGGTSANAPLVAAVPMFDLAERDDAPPRPIHPLTGQELTPAEARVFTARIGEPWGVTPAQPTVGGTMAEAPPAAPTAVEPGQRGPAVLDAAATASAPRSWQPLLMIAVIASVVVSMVLLRARQRRMGGQPR